jgi:cold shock protein
MTIGTVRWFDAHKGYGFIKPDDGGVDVMVDICALERAGMASLARGQRLGFEVVRDERIGKTCAENLSVFCDTSRRALVGADSPSTPSSRIATMDVRTEGFRPLVNQTAAGRPASDRRRLAHPSIHSH